MYFRQVSASVFEAIWTIADLTNGRCVALLGLPLQWEMLPQTPRTKLRGERCGPPPRWCGILGRDEITDKNGRQGRCPTGVGAWAETDGRGEAPPRPYVGVRAGLVTAGLKSALRECQPKPLHPLTASPFPPPPGEEGKESWGGRAFSCLGVTRSDMRDCARTQPLPWSRGKRRPHQPRSPKGYNINSRRWNLRKDGGKGIFDPAGVGPLQACPCPWVSPTANDIRPPRGEGTSFSHSLQSPALRRRGGN